MKKFILAVALSLVSGVAAEAGAFSDLPANHWAYEAIEKMTSKGIVNGFPDNTFKGDKSLTRYEMALVVARLLSELEHKEEVTPKDVEELEKLTVEFSDELSLVGIKVTALEDDLLVVKEDVANLKNEVFSFKKFIQEGGNDKVKLSGDVLVRHYDFNEEKAVHGAHRTESVIRLRVDAKVDENVYVGGMWRLLDDRNNGIFASSQWNGANKKTGDVEAAFLKINDFLGKDSSLKVGRDWFSHGHGLVVHNFMDAISYTRKFGNLDLALNCFYDRGNSLAGADYRNIWNLNADYNYKGHKFYLGFYYNSRDFKGSLDNSSADAVYATGQNDMRIELGASGKLTNSGKFTYDAAAVRDTHKNSITTRNSNGTVRVNAAGKPVLKDEEGWLYYGAVGYNSNEGLAVKASYLFADDESHHSISREDANRWHMGEESLYEDLYWLNCGGMNGDDFMNLKDMKFQLTYNFKKHNRSSVRFAYDNIKSKVTLINGMRCPKVNLDMFTLEYCYKLADSARIRLGYHNAKDKDGGIVTFGSNAVAQTKKQSKQSIFFTEIYSQF